MRWPSYLALVLACGSASGQDLHRVVWDFGAMGTEFRITICAGDTAGVAVALGRARASVARIELVLSDYDPRSEVSRLGADDAGPASATLNAAWQASEVFRIETEGAFDVTLGPLTRAWRRAARRGRLPATGELSRARAASGREAFAERGASPVTLRTGAGLDFGGIGKGIAADSVLALLTEAGFASALVNAGGDVTAGAAPAGAVGWNVQVPGGAIWSVSYASVASSGDSEQFVEVDGVRYSHILDPSTGLGLRDAATVTVLAESGAAADALATALSVRPDLAKSVIREERVAIFGNGSSIGRPPLALAASPTCTELP